jgi:cell wall assembly regulator SMI1
MVTEAWARIEEWLRHNSPGSVAKLAAPAPAEEIAAAEKRLGLKFPAELVESLRRHNGLTEWANLLPEADPQSVAEIVEWHEIRMELAPDFEGFDVHPPNTEPWWHERWLPFAAAGGNLQVIDLRTGPDHGRLGFAPNNDGGDFSDAYPSLGVYLTRVAEALETGTAIGYWHPYFTADGEIWWSTAGETELNGSPLRPVR